MDGDPTTGTADQDRKTAKTYAPDGSVKTLTASNPTMGEPCGGAGQGGAFTSR